LAPAKQKADTTSIDQIIETLKKRIEEAEADSANGVIEAEQRLESYKNQLTRAQDLKSKISHL
jgi:vacuolar-type H+-ATPase subunit H